MPVLATRERLTVEKGTKVLAKFADGSPAWVERPVGKGAVVYVAAHPGLAFLWSAVQPPEVPDRGPGTHTVPTRWDPGARALIAHAARKAGAAGTVTAAGDALLDARLLEAPAGYILPVANYSARVGGKVGLSVVTPRKVVRAVSAYHGELPLKKGAGRVEITLPSLGYGDVLRLEVAKAE
jgi:hypothetical protein